MHACTWHALVFAGVCLVCWRLSFCCVCVYVLGHNLDVHLEINGYWSVVAANEAQNILLGCNAVASCVLAEFLESRLADVCVSDCSLPNSYQCTNFDIRRETR